MNFDMFGGFSGSFQAMITTNFGSAGANQFPPDRLWGAP